MHHEHQTISDKFIDGKIERKIKIKIPFNLFKKGSLKKLFNNLKKKINL